MKRIATLHHLINRDATFYVKGGRKIGCTVLRVDQNVIIGSLGDGWKTWIDIDSIVAVEFHDS